MSPLLAHAGLAHLGRRHEASALLWLTSALAGGLAGAVAVATSDRADVWQLAPALTVWGSSLVAAAACDAVTQRIPTPLVRQATVLSSLLLGVALVAHGDWRGLVLSGVCSIAAGLTMTMCWRYAGAGFGDVRLAFLGGLGLGHVTHEGLQLGLATVAVTTAVLAAVALARGGSRKTMIPYGPALVAGFLVAAAV
ncbi:peptidase [Modestobacter muralis]|uniref:peptidase n=1 Tax=Modestobacter muralis TaxID=1608614 RepID=UPI0030B8DF21